MRWLILLVGVSSACESGPDGDPFAAEVAWSIERLPFAPANTVLALGGDSIALIDASTQEVVVTSTTNGNSRRMGRRGEGPGEFQRAYDLRPSGADHLWVVDVGLLRATRLGLAGEARDVVPLPSFPLKVLGDEGDSLVVLWGNAGIPPRLGKVSVLDGVHSDGHDLTEVIEGFREELGGREMSFLGATVGGRGGVLVGSGQEYALHHLTEDGRYLGSTRRPDVPQELPMDDEVDAYRYSVESLGEGAGMAFPDGFLEERLREFESKPESFFVPSRLATDSAGRVWVPTLRGGRETSLIDVFDSGGDFLGTVSFRHHVKAATFTDSSVIVLVERTTGPNRLQDGIDVYRIATLALADSLGGRQ